MPIILGKNDPTCFLLSNLPWCGDCGVGRKEGFLTPARRDFLRAVDFYSSESDSAALGLIEEVEDALDLPARFPELGGPAPGGTRSLLLHSYPYSLIYRTRGNTVLVFAMRHHARAPQATGPD